MSERLRIVRSTRARASILSKGSRVSTLAPALDMPPRKHQHTARGSVGPTSTPNLSRATAFWV
jgi:hypothetical protein